MANTLRFEFIAQDHIVFQGDVEMVIAPGANGTLGILPRHAPLMTVIVPGELIVKLPGNQERYFAVGGGFMEVRPDKVTLLARSGESAEQIDLQRALEARQRAEALLAQIPRGSEERRQLMEQALIRSKVRLKVAERRRRQQPKGPVPTPGEIQE
ncbi:MAG: ATP synthase F1 subunit epsilon [Caldilineales bacterium]|nr:ATP synthase F1 subunit epsilon [Caldilineales bacterium]MDW8316872.1 ATP synthase F1 subunit epsilon [Anaerolineae bacterium]